MFVDSRVDPWQVRAAEESRDARERAAEERRFVAVAEASGGAAAAAKAARQWLRLEAKRAKRQGPPRPGQHLVLWAWHPLLAQQLCCFPTPAPPPALTRPAAAAVRYRHIDLTWEVPDYDGEPVRPTFQAIDRLIFLGLCVGLDSTVDHHSTTTPST
jgi:hypothetical protein